MKNKDMNEEQVQEFMDILTGKSMPDEIITENSFSLSQKGVGFTSSLSLSQEDAFFIVWVLQEHYGIIPDNFEKCDRCDVIFDTHNSGYYLDDQYELDGETLPKEYHGHWCDWCVPCVDFEMK